MHRTTLYPCRAQQPCQQTLQGLLQQGQGKLKDSRIETRLGLRCAASSQEHTPSPNMLAIGGACYGQTQAWQGMLPGSATYSPGGQQIRVAQYRGTFSSTRPADLLESQARHVA